MFSPIFWYETSPEKIPHFHCVLHNYMNNITQLWEINPILQGSLQIDRNDRLIDLK